MSGRDARKTTARGRRRLLPALEKPTAHPQELYAKGEAEADRRPLQDEQAAIEMRWLR